MIKINTHLAMIRCNEIVTQHAKVLNGSNSHMGLLVNTQSFQLRLSGRQVKDASYNLNHAFPVTVSFPFSFDLASVGGWLVWSFRHFLL